MISQGVERIGADALAARGLNGAGIRIAIVDLGFGDTWRDLLGKELPPLTQIDAVKSFDHTSGKPDITGISNGDQPTGHGANVAQVVWDIAPGARYTLVNYHARLELSQAVDWLVNGPDGKPGVDIVVHSNSFLDGPFDGTGVREGRRSRARRGHLLGELRGQLRAAPLGGRRRRLRQRRLGRHRPFGRGYISFPLTAGIGVGATLYWSACPERRRASRRERLATRSTSRTPPPARPSSTPRVRPTPRSRPAPWATYRPRRAPTGCASSRARRTSSATSRSRRRRRAGQEATVASSIPTPGDARGSFTVGARDWQGDAPAAYS